jgi:hypothetical protein
MTTGSAHRFGSSPSDWLPRNDPKTAGRLIHLQTSQSTFRALANFNELVRAPVVPQSLFVATASDIERPLRAKLGIMMIPPPPAMASTKPAKRPAKKIRDAPKKSITKPRNTGRWVVSSSVLSQK